MQEIEPIVPLAQTDTKESGIKYVEDKIRSSYSEAKQSRNLKNLLPDNYAPDTNMLLKDDIGNRDKQSFETKTYNVGDAYAQLQDGSLQQRYDSYQVGRDNAEYAADTQSTSEKWGNGVSKFLGKVGVGIVGGTVGILDGIFEGIKEGSFRSTYDNQFSAYLDGLNEKLDYELPNYYKKGERELGFVDSLGSANFYADQVLGGAAFTVSAIASEAIWSYATGGASLATTAARGANLTSKLLGAESRFAKSAQAMAKAKDLVSKPALQTYLNAKLPVELATKLGKVGQMANVLRFAYTSAGFEAGMEARMYIKEMEGSFRESYMSKNGVEPSEEETKIFQENLTNSANSLYGFNLAIVGSSNLLTIGRIFDMKSPLLASSKWANSKLFGIGLTENAGKVSAQIATKGQKIAQYGWGIGKSPLIEGLWEEGMQSVGSNTAKNWIESSYDPKYLGNTIAMSDAFTQGLSQTYGTKEGMKEVGIGMLIGLLTGSGISLAKGEGIKGELSGAIKKTKEIEDFFQQKYAPNQIAQTLALSGRIQSANQQADKAEEKGDFTGGELARQTAIIAQVSHAYNLEYLDETVQRTEAGIRNIGNDMLMKEYGVDEAGAEALKETMVQNYKSTAETFKKNRQYSEYYLGNKLSKEEKEKLGGMSLSQLKDAVAYELTLGEKVHDFSQDLLDAIKSEVGSSMLGVNIGDALTIENILLKAGTETRNKAVEKEGKLKRLNSAKEKLEKAYKQVEKTLTETTDIESRKAFLNKADKIRNQISDIQKQKETLTREYSLLLTTANLKNPFGNSVSDLLVTEETLSEREANIKTIQEIIAEYRNINPQRGAKLEKLVSEYSKSMYAFKRYADLSRQLSDPTLGVRGKRNFITEMRTDKTPNEITVEFLESISNSYSEKAKDFLADSLAQKEEISQILDGKPPKPEGDSIQAPPEESTKEAKTKEINKKYDDEIATLENKESEATSNKSNWRTNIEDIKSELSKFSTKEEKLEWLRKNNYLEDFTIGGKQSNYFKTATGRVIIKIKIGNIVVPFYISTGNGGKADVAVNKWYVFFGVGENGWFNKTSGKDINTQYDVQVFQDIAEVLNSIGSIKEEYKVHQNSSGLMDLKGIQIADNELPNLINFINPIQPTINGDGLKVTPEQLAQLKENIQLVKNRVDSELRTELLTEKTTQEKINELNKERKKELNNLNKRESQSILGYIKELIQNSPYLLEYYGAEQTPTIPTEAEIAEFEDLATRALADPLINNKTLSFKNPSSFKQKGKNKVSLTTQEITRLQELNEKLANWKLLGVYGSAEGVSIADMITQEASLNEEAEVIEGTPELQQEELQASVQANPSETDDGQVIRNSSILQTYQDVFTSDTAQGTVVHHMTIEGLIDRLEPLNVNYVKVETKNGKETLSEAKEDVKKEDLKKLARQGGRFTILLVGFEPVTVEVIKGGQLLFKKREDYTKTFEKAGLETKMIQSDPNRKGKLYFPVYDLKTGKKMVTTFEDADNYSPGELYNLLPGKVVSFSLDLESTENKRLIKEYQDGLKKVNNKNAKSVQELENELMNQLQITASSDNNQKYSDLKAAYDTDNNPEFLKIRLSALNVVKESLNSKEGVKSDIIKLPFVSKIVHILLGTLNFTYENAKIKFFNVDPKRIENYGYIENGKLVLKNSSGIVRTDFIKGMMKKNLMPVIVVKQGKYLIAIPVSLNRTEANIGTNFLENLKEEIANGSPRNFGKISIEFNQLLKENGLSPSKYGLQFLDTANQNLFDDNGDISDRFMLAIEKLNEIKSMVDVKSWLTSAHKKEDLASEITSPVDINENVASSPKPIVNFEEGGVEAVEENWYDKALRTGEISDEKATELVDLFLGNYGISPENLELVQENPKIAQLLKEALKLEPNLKSKVEAAIGKIENC